MCSTTYPDCTWSCSTVSQSRLILHEQMIVADTHIVAACGQSSKLRARQDLRCRTATVHTAAKIDYRIASAISVPCIERSNRVKAFSSGKQMRLRGVVRHPPKRAVNSAVQSGGKICTIHVHVLWLSLFFVRRGGAVVRECLPVAVVCTPRRAGDSSRCHMRRSAVHCVCQCSCDSSRLHLLSNVERRSSFSTTD